MKAGIFMLTKSEQRVIVLVILGLLTAGFVRYWRDVLVHPAAAAAPASAPAASASPLHSIDDEPSEPDEAQPSDASNTSMPSPQSSP